MQGLGRDDQVDVVKAGDHFEGVGVLLLGVSQLECVGVFWMTVARCVVGTWELRGRRADGNDFNREVVEAL